MVEDSTFFTAPSNPEDADQRRKEIPPPSPANSPKTPGENPSPDPWKKALEEFIRAWEKGERPDPEAFCRAHPEAGPGLAEEIQKFLLKARTLGGGPLTSPPPPLSPPPPGTTRKGPRQIGPYKVLRLLGEGGMGQVFLVQQERPVRRKAALKLVRPGMHTRGALKRFDAERQALAILNHPCVAKVLDAGGKEESGPYFVMEYIPGKPIKQYCEEKGLDVKQRIRLFMKVLEGIRHAHQKGIIHRDLKPRNILVTEEDGAPLPKIIDFGLARALEGPLVEGSLYSIPGQVLGTPEYMAPEQTGYLEMDPDTRTDIYSLGVVLYELLTGELPYPVEGLSRKSLFEIQRRIVEEDPVRPSTKVSSLPEEKIPKCGLDRRALARRLKGELDWILMKALEKDPERRYQSAAEFLEDLERHLKHEPLQAGPPSPIYRTRKYLQKHALAAAAVSFLALLLLGWLYSSMKSARELARTEMEAKKRVQKVLAYANDSIQRLADMAAVKEENHAATETAWTEDFDEYEPGPFPAGRKLPRSWRLAGDNKQINIVPTPDLGREGDRCLLLRGNTTCPDHALVSVPLDERNLSYSPEFVVRFFLRLSPTRRGKKVEAETSQDPNKDDRERFGALLCRGPDYRDGSSPLLAVRKSGEIHSLNESFPRKYPWSPESFHYLSIHYRRVSVDSVAISLFLDSKHMGRIVRKAGPGESSMGWLMFSSGNGDAWLDRLQVLRLPAPQPWRKYAPIRPLCSWGGKNDCPGAPSAGGPAYLLLSPQKLDYPSARRLARTWGGALAWTGFPTRDEWILEHFGKIPFWVEGGRWDPLLKKVSPFHPGKTGGSKPLLPALLEFRRLPPTASAVVETPGCRPGGGNPPTLRLLSPPVPGRKAVFLLGGVSRNERAFLLADTPFQGRKDSKPPLDPSTLTPGPCRLSLPPAACLPFSREKRKGTGPGILELRLPSLPGTLGTRIRCQALLMTAGPKPDQSALSNTLRITLGIPPLPGSLEWAVEAGMGPGKKGMWPGALRALPDGGCLLAGDYRGANCCIPKGKTFSDPAGASWLEGKSGVFLARFDILGIPLWTRSIALGGTPRVAGMEILGEKRARLLFLGRPAASPGRKARSKPRAGRGCSLLLQDFLLSGGKPAAAPRVLGKGEGLLSLEYAPIVEGRDMGFFLAGVFRGRIDLGKKGVSLESPRCFTLFLARFDRRGTLLWARNIAFSPAGIRLRGMVCLPGGLPVVAGSFKKSLGFNGPDPLLTSLNGAYDIFLARFDGQGEPKWIRHAMGVTDDLANDLVLGPGGDLWLTGAIHHQVVFFEELKEKSRMSICSSGEYNVFLARISPSGKPLFCEICTSRGGDNEGTALALDVKKGKVRKVFLAGYFERPMDFGCPFQSPQKQDYAPHRSRARYYLDPTGGPGKKDAFLACFTPGGEFLWASRAGGIGHDFATRLALTPSGHPLVAGAFQSPATFGLGEPNQTVLVKGNLFLARFRP